MSLREKVESSGKPLNKKQQSHRSIPFMLSLLFIKVKTTSKVIIKRSADIGSP